MPLPDKPGLYAATFNGWDEYPFLFRVDGIAPYLTVKLIEDRSGAGIADSLLPSLKYKRIEYETDSK